MITIDQARIDAPHYPRSQEWWQGFVPVWVTATVRDDGTVTLEANDQYFDGDGKIARRRPVCGRRKLDEALTQWVSRLPRLSVAVIESASA